jgi:site-specific DNA-methyltransferase (adenine-specific)
MSVRVEHGDCLAVLPTLAADSIHACVCDPPYHLTSIVKRFGKDGSAPAKGNAAFERASRGFMGKQWDGGDIAFRVETWAEVYRVLKPGAHLIAFSGTRTYHRMVCAIEDAGFEIRDQIGWLYGSGFPKSHDVSKGIDRAAGAERAILSEGKPVKRMIPGADQNGTGSWIKDNGREYVPTETEAATDAARQWQGWGTALKPAWEPIVLARKPLIGTVAANVQAHGTGALNIDGCRVGDFVNDTPPGTDRYNQANFEHGYRPDAYQGRTGWNGNARRKPMEGDEREGAALGIFRPTGRDGEASADRRYADKGSTNFAATPGPRGGDAKGRWPANVIHDGSEEVIAAFPESESGNGAIKKATAAGHQANAYGKESRPAGTPMICHGDSGSAARFFYTSKADSEDRLGSKHPTVKPVDLMAYLCRLVCPPGGTVLDPFAGSGTTGMACMREGFDCILIEREAEYIADIKRRLAHVSGQDAPLFASVPLTPAEMKADSLASYDLALEAKRHG